MDIRHAVGVKAGIPDATLAALPAWEISPAFGPRERAALALATQIVREDEDVTDACFEALRAHFTEPEIVELVFIVGYQTFASKFAKAFRLTPQGFAARDGAVA
jgi:alkylhydroperoxidase family enzyme